MMQIERIGLACSGTYVLGYLAGLLCCADHSRDVQLQGIYAVFIRGIVKKDYDLRHDDLQGFKLF